MSDSAVIDKSVDQNSVTYSTSNNKQVRNANIHFENGNDRGIITREEARHVSKLSISSDAELVNYNLNPYSDEKLGFLSSQKTLTLEARKPGCKVNVTKCFFVKSMPYDVPLQAAYALEKNAFSKEIKFFQKIEPLMQDNYKSERWSPKCYLAKENTIVLEDMKVQGFRNNSRILNEEHLMSAVACVARFHASSLLAEQQLNGKSLNEVYPEVFEEAEYKNTGRKYTWFTTAINCVVSVAKDIGLETSHIFEASKRAFDIAIPSKVKRNVVTHGDLWSNNLLFDQANHCRLVDFQLLRYAPPGQDLMQLLYLCTLRKFREERETDVLECYYKNFKETLELNGFTGVTPSFEEIKHGADEQKFPALISAAINFPTIMIDGKIGAEIMNNLNSYEDYFFRDRKPIVEQIMAMDGEYETRIKDLFRELVEMSFKVDDFPRVS
ncbi:uncharacterized protein LOC131671107 [Phymastichus coffea]|uniref:uncharacterized protein LOC131671107 n=1 Tax=Phymastichus coffea TaxID=108790 RepID=UPI00273AB24A|nr:uncharacterized protein LOC131671107 [Phymastichus coffea]